MKKGVNVFIVAVLILVLLCSCGKTEELTAEFSGEKMEGMEHLYAENEYGYYFDVYSEKSKDEPRNGIIKLENGSDDLYFMIENAGMERKMAVQIFVDYIQVPILVDGQEFFTYIVDADKHFSEEFCFHFCDKIDESVNHKITSVMTAYADKNEVNSEDEVTIDSHSLAYDMILVFDEENELLTDKLYDQEEARELYEDMYSGLIINTDLEEFKRKSPPRLLEVKPGEEIKLSYHVGGFDDCQEVLVLLSLGMEQIQINSQSFIKCKVSDGKIFNGILEITAPEEEGLYDLTGWVIKDPFSESAPESLPLRDMPRFTIKVCG